MFSVLEKAKKMKVRITHVTEKRIYFEVVSTSGNVYTVSIGKYGEFACDCKHFSLYPDKLCSHVIAAILFLSKKV